MPEDLDGKEEDTEQLLVLSEGGEGAREERGERGKEWRRGEGRGGGLRLQLGKEKTRVNETNGHHVLE